MKMKLPFRSENNKSSGINLISAEPFQAGGRVLHSEILQLTVCIWNKEELPYQWKESIIIHIYRMVDKYDSNFWSLFFVTFIQNFVHCDPRMTNTVYK